MEENEITLEDLRTLLQPISDNVSGMRSELKDARSEISEAVTDNKIMNERFNSLKENNKEAHKKLEDSLSKNWELTRKTDLKITRWAGAIGAIAVLVPLALKYLI